jgi:4a-hydroxytetrahydrobiopterin dehydratase
MPDRLSAEDFDARADLPDWRYILGGIDATFRVGSFQKAGELIARVAELADAADHHPDVDLRWPAVVHIRLSTHDQGGLTTLDTELAKTISVLAAESGATSDPTRAAITEIAIDALDASAIMPFWQAVLRYVPAHPESAHESPALVDPKNNGPSVWFQQMDAPRPERSTIHLDIEVAHDVAEERVAAALDAGGRLLTDEYAPSFWVLADSEGNEVCVCTWQGRA